MTMIILTSATKFLTFEDSRIESRSCVKPAFCQLDRFRNYLKKCFFLIALTPKKSKLQARMRRWVLTPIVDVVHLN